MVTLLEQQHYQFTLPTIKLYNAESIEHERGRARPTREDFKTEHTQRGTVHALMFVDKLDLVTLRRHTWFTKMAK